MIDRTKLAGVEQSKDGDSRCTVTDREASASTHGVPLEALALLGTRGLYEQWSWCQACPPSMDPAEGDIVQDPRSWLVVPLLLHAVELLSEDAAMEWLSHPVAGPWWPKLVAELSATPCADPRRVHATILMFVERRVQQNMRVGHESLDAADRLHRAAESTPLGTVVSLRWVVENTMDLHCFIPSVVQDAILAVCAGEELSGCICQLVNQFTVRRPH